MERDSSGLPKSSEISWDIGKSGKGVLSIVVGKKHTKIRKQLRKWFGESSCEYYTMISSSKLVAEEWFIRNGAKYVGRIKKMIKREN